MVRAADECVLLKDNLLSKCHKRVRNGRACACSKAHARNQILCTDEEVCYRSKSGSSHTSVWILLIMYKDTADLIIYIVLQNHTKWILQCKSAWLMKAQCKNSKNYFPGFFCQSRPKYVFPRCRFCLYHFWARIQSATFCFIPFYKFACQQPKRS